MIRHRKRHTQDDAALTGGEAGVGAEGGGGAGPRLDRMERELQLIGDLTTEQRERLLFF